MRHLLSLAFAHVPVLVMLASAPATAATFQVVDEEDGPNCWLEFAVSPDRTLAIFSAKGGGAETLEILLEDKTESGDLAKVPETFEMSFQFADGTRQAYQGTISEYFGEPYAEAGPDLLKKLSAGGSWDLAVTGLDVIHVKDTLSPETFKQFGACAAQ